MSIKIPEPKAVIYPSAEAYQADIETQANLGYTPIWGAFGPDGSLTVTYTQPVNPNP